MVKGFGDLFSESWEEYWSKFMPIFKVFLFLYFIPLVIIMIIVFLLVIPGVFFPGAESLFTEKVITSMDISEEVFFDYLKTSSYLVPIIVLGAIIFIIFMLLSFLSTLAYITIGFSKNKKISFRDAVRSGAKYFWVYVGLAVLQTLALFGLFILLVIPGIIFLVYWLFSSYVLVNENKGVIDSMRGSMNLVRGRWWNIFGKSLLLFLIIIAISIVLNFIPLGDQISYLFITPFAILFLKNLYLDLRKNKSRK